MKDLIELPLSDRQLSKLANGKNVQMSAKQLKSIGQVPGHDLTVTDELFNKVYRASEKNKGVRISASEVNSEIIRPQRKVRGDAGERMAKVRAQRRPKLMRDNESFENAQGSGFGSDLRKIGNTGFKAAQQGYNGITGMGFKSDLGRFSKNISSRANTGIKRAEQKYDTGVNQLHRELDGSISSIQHGAVRAENGINNGLEYLGGSTYKERMNRRFHSTTHDIRDVMNQLVPEKARSKIFDTSLKTASAIAINAAKSGGMIYVNPDNNNKRPGLRRNVRQHNFSPNASEIPRPLLNSELSRMNIGMYPNRTRHLGGSFRANGGTFRA